MERPPEIVYWRCNLFVVPLGSSGNVFAIELAHLFRVFGEDTPLESIALRATMVLPSLLFQKPSKACDHTVCLEQRLQLWKAADINLIQEGRTIPA